MDKKIKIDYLKSINIDFIEEIAQEKFPECKIKRQNWGINAPLSSLGKDSLCVLLCSSNRKRTRDLQKSELTEEWIH